MVFFVLCPGKNMLHFCIVDEGKGDEKHRPQICKLFMRLYTGNRRSANEHCGFFVF